MGPMRLIAGVCMQFDPDLGSGSLWADGQKLPFEYSAGQNMYIGGPMVSQEPQLTGRHSQRSGHKLKTPTVGDPLLVHIDKGKVVVWAYMLQYLNLCERVASVSIEV